MNVFSALGIEPTKDFEKVRTAYRQKALVTHPDKFPNASSKEKEKKTQAFTSLSNAYEEVNTQEKLKNYYDNLFQKNNFSYKARATDKPFSRTNLNYYSIIKKLLKEYIDNEFKCIYRSRLMDFLKKQIISSLELIELLNELKTYDECKIILDIIAPDILLLTTNMSMFHYFLSAINGAAREAFIDYINEKNYYENVFHLYPDKLLISLKLFNEKQRNVFFKNKIKKIKSFFPSYEKKEELQKKLAGLLQLLDSTGCHIVLKAIELDLTKIITNTDELITLLSSLDESQCQSVFEYFKDKLKIFIKTKDQFTGVLSLLKDEQSKTIMFKLFEKQIPRFMGNVTEFSTIMKLFNNEQRSKIIAFVQKKLPTYIKNIDDLDTATKDLNDEQKKIIIDASKINLLEHTHDISDLTTLLTILDSNEVKRVFGNNEKFWLDFIKKNWSLACLLKPYYSEQLKTILNCLGEQLPILIRDMDGFFELTKNLNQEQVKIVVDTLSDDNKKYLSQDDIVGLVKLALEKKQNNISDCKIQDTVCEIWREFSKQKLTALLENIDIKIENIPEKVNLLLELDKLIKDYSVNYPKDRKLMLSFLSETIETLINDKPINQQITDIKAAACAKFLHRDYGKRILTDILQIITGAFLIIMPIRYSQGEHLLFSRTKTNREIKVLKHLFDYKQSCDNINPKVR
ncbi:MAG: hypothetical protein LEGION0398_MBIBDBAK_00603 [Legionellaceae bacterium]